MASKSTLLNQISRSQYGGNVFKRFRQDSVGKGSELCQTCDMPVSEYIVSSGCKLPFCLNCARISKSLYGCLLNGELDYFH